MGRSGVTLFVYDAGDDRVVSEPMLMPRDNPKDEDDGFLVSFAHDAHSRNVKLIVWNCRTFEEGPMECSMSELFPWAVHGSCVQNYNP